MVELSGILRGDKINVQLNNYKTNKIIPVKKISFLSLTGNQQIQIGVL